MLGWASLSYSYVCDCEHVHVKFKRVAFMELNGFYLFF